MKYIVLTTEILRTQNSLLNYIPVFDVLDLPALHRLKVTKSSHVDSWVAPPKQRRSIQLQEGEEEKALDSHFLRSLGAFLSSPAQGSLDPQLYSGLFVSFLVPESIYCGKLQLRPCLPSRQAGPLCEAIPAGSTPARPRRGPANANECLHSLLRAQRPQVPYLTAAW